MRWTHLALGGAVVVVGALLVLVILAGAMPDPSPATVPAHPATVPPAVNGAGDPSAYLTSNATSVSAGNTIRLVLWIAPMNCSTTAPQNQTVVQIEFHLGDGYTFVPSPFWAYGGAPSGIVGCGGAPWNASFPVTYAYRSTGTVDASATVVWADGVERTSNLVRVLVTAPSASVLTSLEGWLIGGSIAVLATLSACLVLRERLPPPPSIPPREA